MYSIDSFGIEDLPRLAKEVVQRFAGEKIWAFYGGMGVGKTTFIKEFCKALLSEDEVLSPSFSLVNEYSAGEAKIFHFDFYRISSLDEAYDMGAEEYFSSGEYCLIEWPELVEPLLNFEHVKVFIEELGGAAGSAAVCGGGEVAGGDGLNADCAKAASGVAACSGGGDQMAGGNVCGASACGGSKRRMRIEKFGSERC